MIKEGKKREKKQGISRVPESLWKKKKENWRGKFHARRESQESTVQKRVENLRNI